MNKLELVDALVTEMGLKPNEMIEYWDRKKAKSRLPRKKRNAKRTSQVAIVAPDETSEPESDEEIDIPADDPVFIRMKEIIAKHLDIDEKQITPKSNIWTDFGADSLDEIEIVMVFEREFGISIPDDIVRNFSKIQDAWKYISKHRKH